MLDYIASKGLVRITIDHVEQAINSLLGEERFIEPRFRKRRRVGSLLFFAGSMADHCMPKMFLVSKRRCTSCW